MNRRPALALTLSLVLGWGFFLAPAHTGLAQTAPNPNPKPQPAPLPPPERVTTPPTPSPSEPAPSDSPPAYTDAEEGTPATLELIRSGKDGKDRTIRVSRATLGDSSGMFALCGPQEDEPQDAPTMAVFNERDPAFVTITIDKNKIEVPLAVVTQRNKPDGSSGDGRVEASAGSARFLDDVPAGAKDRLERCAVEVKPAPKPDTVLVTQGKTHLKGKNLVYDESDGIARIDGPITFTRENDKDLLKGKSERIEVNVDEEKTLLVGNVVLESAGGRISKAGRVEYDDAKNEARLYATPEAPAESVKGSDILRLSSGYIKYNLETNDVVVVKEGSGNITGEFQDGERKK